MESVSKIGSYKTGYAGLFFSEICVETTASLRVLRQLYPNGAKCASCGAMITGRRALETFWRGDRTYCAGCGSKFSPRSNTILADSHVSYAQFEVICVLISLGVDHKRIATLAGTTVDTVTVWHSKIRFWESVCPQ